MGSNFGLVVIAWVAWIIAHGAIEAVPRPNHVLMVLFFVIALVDDSGQ